MNIWSSLFLAKENSPINSLPPISVCLSSPFLIYTSILLYLYFPPYLYLSHYICPRLIFRFDMALRAKKTRSSTSQPAPSSCPSNTRSNDSQQVPSSCSSNTRSNISQQISSSCQSNYRSCASQQVPSSQTCPSQTYPCETCPSQTTHKCTLSDGIPSTYPEDTPSPKRFRANQVNRRIRNRLRVEAFAAESVLLSQTHRSQQQGNSQPWNTQNLLNAIFPPCSPSSTPNILDS